MDMFRVTARWDGWSGAPGYSNFYFRSGFLDGGLLGDEAQALADRVQAAFGEISTLLPEQVSISIEPEVPVIDSDTGVAQDFNTITPPATISGRDGTTFAGPAGAVVTWRTSDLRAGRRIRGRTFLVPLSNNVYQSDGTLKGDQIAFIGAFADTLMGDELESELGVWSRPSGGSGGVFATVTGFTIPDMAAVLRSRRD